MTLGTDPESSMGTDPEDAGTDPAASMGTDPADAAADMGTGPKRSGTGCSGSHRWRRENFWVRPPTETTGSPSAGSKSRTAGTDDSIMSRIFCGCESNRRASSVKYPANSSGVAFSSRTQICTGNRMDRRIVSFNRMDSRTAEGSPLCRSWMSPLLLLATKNRSNRRCFTRIWKIL